jgi:hypothetical protein
MKFATAVLILGMLAGCAVSPSDNTLDYRPGDGVVQAVEAARVALPNPGLLRPRWTEGYQLTLRMDDGTTQRVTQDSAAFKAGERVRITSDGRVLKAAPADDVSVARYRPGIGVVQVVQPGRVVLPAQGSGVIPGSEAAGGSYGSPVERVFRPRSSEGYQVTLNMEDGSAQRRIQSR